MSVVRYTCFSVLVCLAFAVGVFAQAPAAAAAPYSVVEIEKFTIKEGVEFPAKDLEELMTYLVLHFNKSNRFDQVFLTTDAMAQTASTRRARISGEVVKYAKGSRAARYLVGFGAGRTKLVANVKVTDAETGQVLLEQPVDGHVYGGLFGGETDSAKGGMTSDIIKAMTKKGYAGAKKKDK